MIKTMVTFRLWQVRSKSVNLTAAWRSTMQQLHVVILFLSDNKIRLKLKELCQKTYQISNSENCH